MVSVAHGTFRIIRVDGSEETFERKPTLDLIHHAIGCETFDSVTLDRENEIVMLVDDVGLVDGLPVNLKATELMKEAFGPNYPNPICGDVAIVWDGDFA